MEINFNLPRKSSVKKTDDPYPDQAVLTIKKQPLKRASFKFCLNSKAINLMGFTLAEQVSEQIVIGFNPTDVFLVNKKDEYANMTGIRLAKNSTFATKVYYQYMKDFFNLDTSKDNHFLIHEPIDHYDLNSDLHIPVYRITQIEEVKENTTDVVELVAVEEDVDLGEMPDIE